MIGAPDANGEKPLNREIKGEKTNATTNNKEITDKRLRLLQIFCELDLCPFLKFIHINLYTNKE